MIYSYQVIVSLDVKSVNETLMQKNNMGIIDDDMRIRKMGNFLGSTGRNNQ